MRNVTQIGSCNYLEVNDEGLVIETKGVKKTLPVDTVVICAGQVSEVSLHKSLLSSSSSSTTQPKLFLIGGSQEAGELDAKRAIDQGTRSVSLSLSHRICLYRLSSVTFLGVSRNP
jgi:2,4-dienoyl-CoA reductase (NADPH2)